MKGSWTDSGRVDEGRRDKLGLARHGDEKERDWGRVLSKIRSELLAAEGQRWGGVRGSGREVTEPTYSDSVVVMARVISARADIPTTQKTQFN